MCLPLKLKTIMTSSDLTDSSRKLFQEPIHTVNLSEYGQILAVHFSPYEWSQDVILVALSKKIIVAQVNYQDNVEIEILAELEHNASCVTMILSPEAAINIIPTNLQFCTASTDFKLRMFKGNLTDENTCQELSGHTSYINDVSYDPENNYVVSVSDDHTAKIWSVLDNKCSATLRLTSPGMSTCWHREDNSKLLVAEKIGIIRFYNVSTQKPILSLDYCKPLASAHWAPFNSQLIASLQMGELILWDLTRPSRPIQTKLVHTESGGSIKFCPNGELVGTVNGLDGTLKVTHIQNLQQRLNAKVVLPTNITWHFRYSLVCVGDDGTLCFWKVVAK